jgi:tetratricopeptide (TPR) repeat protein
VLVRIASQAVYQNPELGRDLVRQSIELARPHGLTFVEAQALGVLGEAARLEGNLDEAWQHHRRAADLAGRCGFHWWQTYQLAALLELSLELGRLEEGRRAGREALRLATTMNDRWAILSELTGLARVELADGNPEQAGRLWGAATEAAGHDPHPYDDSFREFAAPLAESTDTQFVTAVEAGRELGLAAATRLALGEE